MESSDVVPLCEPLVDGNARRYLNECISTNFVSSVGPFVDRFEREFAAYVGARHAVACASGTAALHVAMRLLEIGPGDAVALPTLTFIASANPVLYQNGVPLFVDAELDTWNLDVDRFIGELERRAAAGIRQPKALEVVHLLGHPQRLDELTVACERYGVPIIEDASEALGARFIEGRYAGRHVGVVGRIGCFSFNGNKIITTGGGGMITTDDPALARRAKHLTTQARMPGAEYRHDEVGYNYRLTNLAASLGVAQLERLPAFLERKREIAARYDAAFADIDGLIVPPRASWAEPSMWLYTIRLQAERTKLDSRSLMSRLAARSIQTRPIWSPLHTMAMYATASRLGGAISERLFAEALSLPCSVSLTDAQQKRVIDAVRAELAG